jgi:hypothetical protein
VTCSRRRCCTPSRPATPRGGGAIGYDAGKGSAGAVLVDHRDRHVPERPRASRFATRSGGYLARSYWNQTFRRSAEAIGLPAVRPHELRHTGAPFAAATGATTKELMRRLGHSSPAAALLYQHAADDRDADIARLSTPCSAPSPRRRMTTSTSGRSDADREAIGHIVVTSALPDPETGR